MLYLFAEIWIWMLAALLVGVLLGWILWGRFKGKFAAMQRDNHAFSTLDAWQEIALNLSPTGREPVRVNVAQVSGGLLKSLNVQPLRGRWIESNDDREGAPMTVVLSYGLWQGAFGGEEKAIGREVLINGVKANVIGIMPRGFEFPPGDPEPAELWTPLQLTARDMERWGNHRLSLIGRLKPGLGLAQANQDLDRLERQYGEVASNGVHRPNPKTHTLAAFPLLDETVGDVRPAMLLMLGATALVLLIACANVANLLLARAQARQREVAVRQAMGATTSSLLGQFFVEGLLLSGTAALAGLGLAWLILKVILALGSQSIPRASEVRLDGEVLLVTVAAALLTGLVFALAPLAQTLRTKLFDTLKSTGARAGATREAHWVRGLLVTGEIALALILLAGAGLLLDSFWKLMRTDPGVRSAGVMSMRISLPAQNYAKGPDVQRFWRDALERVRAVPGVTGAALLAGLPPQRPINANDTYIEGLVAKPNGPFHNVDYWNTATPGLFELLGVTLLRGRLIDSRDGDGAPPVVVVNEKFEQVFYGGQSAVGRRIKPNGKPDDASPWFTIVGVVKDMKNRGLDQPAGTELFFSLPQAAANYRTATLLVKTGLPDPWSVFSPVRDSIRALDSALPLAQVRPLDDVISASRAQPRFLAALLGLFALVALGLAATGIFSVMSYAVAQRTNEFGLRLALGASAQQVLGLVFQQAGRLIAAGVALGLLGGWLLTRSLRGAITGLGDIQWLPIAVTALLLIGVTLAACFAPARRATRVDPAVALRVE